MSVARRAPARARDLPREKSACRCVGFCPCDRLAALGVRVVERSTPAYELGYFDPGAREVVLDLHLSAAQRRSTLAHELVHAELGDRSSSRWWSRVNSDTVEDCADEVAARNLVMLPDLVAALIERDTPAEVAADLGVDDEMVQVRIDTLTPGERRYVDRRCFLALNVPHNNSPKENDHELRARL